VCLTNPAKSGKQCNSEVKPRIISEQALGSLSQAALKSCVRGQIRQDGVSWGAMGRLWEMSGALEGAGTAKGKV